jgi:ATP-dependent DNA helicase RecG
MEVAGQANRTRFRNRILKPLIKAKFVRMTIPNNPQSPKQKYIITDKGKKMIENSREGRS